MRVPKFSLAIAAGLTMLSFTACKKSDQQFGDSTMSDAMYTVKDGRVAFSSFNSYRSVVEDKHKQDQFEKLIQQTPGLITLRQRSNFMLRGNRPVSARLAPTGIDSIDSDIEDMVTSSFLGSFVNSDGFVEIGDYIFNINLQTDRVYAMHTSYLSGSNGASNYLALKNEDTTLNYIMSFSTNDEVLDALEDANYPTEKPTGGFDIQVRCFGSGAPKKKDEGVDYWPTYANAQDHLSGKLVYQKAGIYFALVFKLKGFQHHPWQNWEIYYSYKYERRCSSEVYKDATTEVDPDPNNGDNNIVRRPYEGSRALIRYSVNYQAYVLGHDPTSNSWLLSKSYHIDRGY